MGAIICKPYLKVQCNDQSSSLSSSKDPGTPTAKIAVDDQCSKPALNANSRGLDDFRPIISDAEPSIQRSVLRGAFHTGDANAWRAPTAMLAVFVSSTFTDTQLERGYLIDELLFQLREEADQYGIQIVFVDMRWGIRDRSSLNHMTWFECSAALEWCKKQSMGTCFLSLQGDKYGYTPLPRVLKKAHLDAHLARVDVPTDLRAKLTHYYRLNNPDTNAHPEPEYVLRSLAGPEEKKLYYDDELSLVTALNGLSCETDRYSEAGLCVGQSITEWEVRAAICGVPADDARSRDFCWSHRQLDVANCQNKDFYDGSPNLSELKLFMNEKFPKDRVCQYEKLPVSALISAEDSNDQSPRSQYLERYKSFVGRHLKDVLYDIAATMKSWSQDGCGLGLPGPALSEMLHHYAWARKKVDTFFGRKDLTSQLLHFIEHPEDPASRVGKVGDDFDGITACVVGVSGAGKTALMAKVASLVYELHQDSMIPVLIRFCGTSAGSHTARDLIVSLCHQIEFVFKLKNKRSLHLQSATYEVLVSYFHELLSKHAVYLFIDSLDQLSDADAGRSRISFLRGARPHKDTRIIVSCLPDDKEIDPVTKKMYQYWCETRLKEHKVPCVTAKMSSDNPQSIDESMAILDALLRARKRKLTPEQRVVLHDRIGSERQKTALYIHLLVGVVCHWESDVDAASSLSEGGVHALIKQMFEALASVYGSHLVKLILGFLAFSQKGVSHLELEDLLSLDAELMNCDENMSQDQLDKSVFQFHRDVKVKRVPSHVVVRVLNSLEDLVISGEQSCLQLYHRQLKEAAQDWLEESYKEIVCRHLAMYFGNLVTEQEVKQKRLSRQGWTKDGHSLSPFIEASTVNNRRCVEAVRAMLACGMLAEAEAELCNFESVCCRLRCGEAFAMVSDVIELDRKWSSSRTHHYLRWLRRDTHMMLCSPIKRLLTSASDQPKISLVFEDAAKFIAKMKDIYPELQYGRKFENNNDGFDASLYVVDVGFGNVRSVCYSPDGHKLASGSAYLACLWDAETGASLLELLKLRSMANSVCFAPDGSRVAVGSEDKAVRIVDAKSGTLLLELTELSGRVFSVCYSPNGQHLASALDHGTVCIWDIQTGVLKASCRHDGMVLSVCYSPNGSRLASGSSIGSVCVWNAETGDLMYQTEKHSGYASSVCYSPNGLFLASGSGKGAVRIWDAETGVLQHLLDKHTGRVASICYSPDGRRLASGSQDCTVRIWDPKTQACLKELRGHGGIVNSVCYSPDGRRLASASNDRTVRIWDANTDTPTPVIDGHSKGVLAVCFSPDGLRVASGSEDYTIRIWDAGRGALLLKLQEDFMCGYVTSVCYSRNGRRIASVSDRGVHIWDAETGKLLRAMTARTDEDMLSSVCFCADDNRVLAGFKSGSVSIGDTDSGNWGPMLSGHTNVVNAVCCAPNGRHWVSVSKEGAACIWGAEAGECFKTVTNEFLCFSTDGRRMISRSGKGMCILDLESCEELAEISGIHENRYVSSAAYNTENHIAAIAVKHEIYLWNMNTAELLNVLDGHSNRVESLCFSPDGRFLVSGSADSTIRIWEVV